MTARLLTLNQVYSNEVQCSDIKHSIKVASLMMCLSQQLKNSEPEISNLWKKRAYTFLNRACELACLPVHRRLVETLIGVEEAWFSYSAINDFKELFESDHTVFLGYCFDLTESQARIRALS